MAQSKIIKELVSNEISLEEALNRLLIIASDIENDELAQWVENELNGYSDSAELPAYRVIDIGDTYFVYSGINGRFKVENAPLPLLEILGVDKGEHPFNIPDGVNLLITLTTGKNQYGHDVTAVAEIVRETTGIFCASIRQLVPPNVIVNVISAIKSKLIKVLIKLDKEFGCLDELDVDITKKDPEEVRRINTMIINCIFEDRSIKIGDKNRIDGTEIRSGENHG